MIYPFILTHSIVLDIVLYVCKMCQISILDINKSKSKPEASVFSVYVLCKCCGVLQMSGSEAMQSGDFVPGRPSHRSCHGVAVVSLKMSHSVFCLHEKCCHCQ